jgi:hypothetical protein
VQHNRDGAGRQENEDEGIGKEAKKADSPYFAAAEVSPAGVATSSVSRSRCGTPRTGPASSLLGSCAVSLSLGFYTLVRFRHSDLQQLPRSVQILHLMAHGPMRLNLPLWTRACTHASRRSKKMLWTIFVVLVALWLLGMLTSYTAGGLIHILLVIGLVVLVIRLLQGRRVLG